MEKVEAIQYQVHILAEEIKRLNVDLSSAKANFIATQDHLSAKSSQLKELEERLKGYQENEQGLQKSIQEKDDLIRELNLKLENYEGVSDKAVTDKETD